jgi:hypothetical protein
MNVHFDSSDLEPVTEAIVKALERRLEEMASKGHEEPIMVGAQKAAALYDVSPSTIDRFKREEGLPFVKREGGRVLYRLDALREFAAAKEIVLKPIESQTERATGHKEVKHDPPHTDDPADALDRNGRANSTRQESRLATVRGNETGVAGGDPPQPPGL